MNAPDQIIEQLLGTLDISFERFDHAALFSTKDAGPEMPGAHTKQLLMHDKKADRYILAIVMHDKKVDTRVFAKELGMKELNFASADALQTLLHVTPGSVTPFGLINDTEKKIEVIIDEDAWKIGTFRFHPLINTSTLIINTEALEKFLKHIGHTYSLRRIPNKKSEIDL